MKKIIFFVTLLAFFIDFQSAQAQKFGYIDTEYITSKMPDYKKAQESMDTFSEKWLKEVQTKQEEISKLKQQFQQEEILLTADMKRERQKAIEDKDNSVKELQNKVFSVDGLLFQKRKEVMKNILDDIYIACQKVARKKRLAFIFDKASDISIIYSDPQHDYTDYVIEELGITPEKDEKKSSILDNVLKQSPVKVQQTNGGPLINQTVPVKP